MTALKSRAETCAINLYLNPETYNEDKADGYKKGYMHGAMDQHKEDIDKACEWLKKNMNIHQISFALTNPPEPGKFINAEEAFRKAMEE